MPEFQRRALVLGEGRHRLDHLHQPLLPDDLLARRGRLGVEPSVEPRRRLLDGLLQRERPLGPSAAPAAEGVGDLAGEDRPEPGEVLGLGRAAELVSPLVGLQERLLDDVGGVDLRAEPRAELEPGEQPELFAQALRRRRTDLVLAGHAVPLG